MIQRKQTVFLFLAAVAAIVSGILQAGTLPMILTAIATAVIQIVAIFLFKNRKVQSHLCVVCMFLLIVWYIGLGVLQHSLRGTLDLTWPMFLPAVSILFTFIARKYILADEKLVRSLDRIR